MPQMLQSEDLVWEAGGEGGAGAVRRFHQTGNPVTLERDCSVSVEVTEKHLQDSRRVMRASLEERWGQM